MNKSTNTVNGNVVGSAIGGGTVNARDIQFFRDRITKTISDSHLRTALVSARERIETLPLSPADKVNASDALGQLTHELESDEPKPSIVRKSMKYFKDYAEPVFKLLTAVKVISDLYEMSQS